MSERNDCSRWDFRLFMAGKTPASHKSLMSLKNICDKYLCNSYSLEVIDVDEDPAIAEVEQIFAAPTLIRKFPLPTRKIVGDFSDAHRVAKVLELLSQRADD